MRHYYQWDERQRIHGDRLVKKAISEGLLPDPNTIPCKICGKDAGLRQYHQEDYTPEHIVENSICVCAQCHRQIHLRWWHMEEYKTYMKSRIHGRKYLRLFNSYYQAFLDAGGVDPAAK